MQAMSSRWSAAPSEGNNFEKRKRAYTGTSSVFAALETISARRVAHHQRKQQRKINHRGLQHMTSQHLGPWAGNRQFQKREPGSKVEKRKTKNHRSHQIDLPRH